MRLRNLRRIDQKDLAKELGVSPQTISNWETGRTEPKLTLKTWRKLADLLGMSLEDLPDDFSPQPISD